MIERRKFITLLGGAAAAWPLVARAQQPGLPVIGFLHAGSSNDFTRFVPPYRQGLKEAEFVEGQNVSIEFRWAEGRYDRLPEMATDFVSRRVAVIAAFGPPAGLAAKSAKQTIPIVFGSGADPVSLGLVSSLARPGGNVTGVSFLSNTFVSKQMQLLRDLAPTANAVGLLVNPNNASVQAEITDGEAGAHGLGQQLVVRSATSEQDIDAAFAYFVQRHVNGIVVGADLVLGSRTKQIVELAAREGLLVISNAVEFAQAGGLMSYGTDVADSYRQAGVYTGKILKGAKPSELPVVQSTKFEFIINLKTARALGLTISNQMQLLADEVIE
jgi:putative ABC transport system substrate-binding protein